MNHLYWRKNWYFVFLTGIVSVVLVLGCQKTNSESTSSSLQPAEVKTNNFVNVKSRRAVDVPQPLYIEPQKERWAFRPTIDSFSEKSLLDLSYLNSAIKGDKSRITLSKDKNSFALANGEPIRFWPVNLEIKGQSKQEMDEQLRFLAKRGVNMVRLHTSLNPKKPQSNINDVDKQVLDSTFRLVASLKKHGVYLTFSPYWGVSVKREGWGKSIGDTWPVPRNPKAKNTAGLLFFDPILQAAYKNWLRALLTTVNPYTGVALKDDPVLAILQIQNEDSLLFWSFNAIAGEDLDLLRSQYGEWLKKRYKSLDQVKQRWSNAKPEGSAVEDDWQRGLISFSNIWHMTRENVSGGFGLRLDDQTRFLVETMKNFNRDVIGFLRNEIGTPVLVNPGNWKTASAEYLDDLERYSYSDGDVMAVNRYVAGRHEGKNAGWAVMNGQKYTDASVLLDPMALPVAIKQPEGYPFLITESSWVPPLSFQAEGPFLVSTMQSLNGVDGYYWFAAGAKQWLPPGAANGFLPSLGKWVVQGPMLLGQFPAAAFSYRMGLVAPGKEIVSEIRSIDDMIKRKKANIFERQGFDVNRDKFWQFGKSSENPADFLQGRVSIRYSPNSLSPHVRNDGHLVDSKAFISASNKQIHWDVALGIALVDAPASQGACGFLYGAEIKTSHARFNIENPYACVWLVALDQKPLNESEKILVQMGTRQFSTGWQTKPVEWTSKKQAVAGREIVAYGKAPWQIETLSGVLELENRNIKKAVIVDANGMAQSPVEFERKNTGLKLQLPRDSLYMLLTK